MEAANFGELAPSLVLEVTSRMGHGTSLVGLMGIPMGGEPNFGHLSGHPQPMQALLHRIPHCIITVVVMGRAAEPRVATPALPFLVVNLICAPPFLSFHPSYPIL